MPMAPPRPCPGCRVALIPRSRRRCEGCEREYERRRRQEPARRAAQDRYASSAWKAFRGSILSARPWCACGCGRAADTVAHIRPVLQFPALMYDPSNVRALTRACHSRESAQRGERWPR